MEYHKQVWPNNYSIVLPTEKNWHTFHLITPRPFPYSLAWTHGSRLDGGGRKWEIDNINTNSVQRDGRKTNGKMTCWTTKTAKGGDLLLPKDGRIFVPMMYCSCSNLYPRLGTQFPFRVILRRYRRLFVVIGRVDFREQLAQPLWQRTWNFFTTKTNS